MSAADPVASPPAWLVDLIVDRPKVASRPRKVAQVFGFTGPSIADKFSAGTSWADILTPHGWTMVGRDDTKWQHPTATSACSATIRHDCLFVYSPNTPFDVTEASTPKGYTKFRAYAVLSHGGDMKAAARALRGTA